MFDAKVFAVNLKNARKGKGLSQKELAEKLFLSTQAVSKWERGEALPDIQHVCRLADLLGLTTDRLLGVEQAGETALIAVDGGGSKTEMVLITTEGRILRRLVLPGSNPNACTVDGCCDILCRGVDEMRVHRSRVNLITHIAPIGTDETVLIHSPTAPTVYTPFCEGTAEVVMEGNTCRISLPQGCAYALLRFDK